jgi:hypothetical protein
MKLLPAVLVTVMLLSVRARADDNQRFGLGLSIAPIAIPSLHLGIAEGPDAGDPHMPVNFVFQWRANSFFALDASLGLPAATGLAVTLGAELFRSLFVDTGRVVSIEVYEAPGILFGFAGPDWYARNENAFVGYNYVTQGLLTFAFRFPAGLRLRWLRIPLDTYLEAQPSIAVSPSVEQLFALAVGFRVRF